MPATAATGHLLFIDGGPGRVGGCSENLGGSQCDRLAEWHQGVSAVGEVMVRASSQREQKQELCIQVCF